MQVATPDSTTLDSMARARQDSINRTMPGYVVDSMLPIEETIRRFQAKVGGSPVRELTGASTSREALVRRFVTTLSVGDSLELGAMLLNAREFIDLVYPESPSTHPPYRQDPDLVWRMMQNPNASGLKRLIRRAGAQRTVLAGYGCDPKPERQGANSFWRNCTLQLVSPKGDTSSHRLFGSVIERHGRFKFVSYRNEF